MDVIAAAEVTLNTDTGFQQSLKQAVDHYAVGDIESFGDTCRELISKHSDTPESYFLIGIMAFLTDDPGRAMTMVQRAYDLDTECATYADVLANLYARNGRLNDGLYYAKLSTTLDPHPVLVNLVVSGLDNYFEAMNAAEAPSFLADSMVAFRNCEFQRAIDLAEKELRLETREEELYLVLGRSYCQVGRYGEAIATFQSLVHLAPSKLSYRLLLADALRCFGRTSQAHATLCSALTLIHDDEVQSLIARRSGLPADLRLGKSMGSVEASDFIVLSQTSFPNKAPQRSGPLRVGLISDQFYNSEYQSVLKPWLYCEDAGLAEIYCYNLFEGEDSTSQNLKVRAKKWSDVSDVDDQTMLFIIDSDELDVVIDYTKTWYLGRDRVLRASNVPVRIGLGESAVPTRELAVTHVVNSDGLMTCNQYESSTRDERIKVLADIQVSSATHPDNVDDLNGSKASEIILGIDLNFDAYSPELIASWMQILTTLPGAKVLLGNRPSIPRVLAEEAYGYFASFGLLDRILIRQGAEVTGDRNQDFWRDIDIYLPSPETISLDAVLMGALHGRPSVSYCPEGAKGEIVEAIMTATDQGSRIARDLTVYQNIVLQVVRDIKEGSVTAKGVNLAAAASSAANPIGTVRDLYGALVRSVKSTDAA